MPANYGERIARVEENTQNIAKSVEKLDAKVDARFDAIFARIDQLEGKYLTRREFSIAKWLVGVAFLISGTIISVIGLYKK